MRRKLLMLAVPLGLLLASLSVPAASALANCSCTYCSTHGPDTVCKLPDGSFTNCIGYQTANCP
jgi:hypothetical protein